MVVVVGVDVHKGTHSAVAVDDVGRQIGQRTVRATDAGHRQLLRWARREFAERRVEFAVEDCRHVSTRLERALLAAGQAVVRVPPKLMAGDPRAAPAPGASPTRSTRWPSPGRRCASRTCRPRSTTQPPGAQAAGRSPRGPGRRAHPGAEPAALAPARARPRVRRAGPRPGPSAAGPACEARLEALTGLAGPPAGRGDPRRHPRAHRADQRAGEGDHRTGRAARRRSCWRCPAAGALTAAKIIGETANLARFRSEACFAMHAGAAPIPASSGKTDRHRLARGGNRQLNAALHRIAITQIRLDGLGRPTTSADAARRHHHGSPPRPQTPPCPHCLQPSPTHRPDRRGAPAAGGLT